MAELWPLPGRIHWFLGQESNCFNKVQTCKDKAPHSSELTWQSYLISVAALSQENHQMPECQAAPGAQQPALDHWQKIKANKDFPKHSSLWFFKLE